MAILTEEQLMLRDAARSWAGENSPVRALRRVRDSGVEIAYDASAWREIAGMGWAGTIIPEEFGGSNLGCLSMGLVLAELGRTLTASPLFISGLVSASALMLGGSERQKAAWLPKIADGALVASLAIEEGARHAPERVALAAIRTGQGWKLEGEKTFVIEGMAAGLFVVAARSSGRPGDTHGVTLFLVPGDANGLSRRRLKMADSRGAAALAFQSVEIGESAVLGQADHGWSVLEPTLDRARAGLCAEMLGAAEQAFQTTLEYMKVRVQFGQPIGSFQALQHRAARLLTDLELARSAVEAALQAIDDEGADAAELVSLAKARMSDTFHLVSNEMVQLHGGIGMTDAHDAGFYLRRARVCEALFGDAPYHRDRYARLLGY